jgi:hypothetical protein
MKPKYYSLSETKKTKPKKLPNKNKKKTTMKITTINPTQNETAMMLMLDTVLSMNAQGLTKLQLNEILDNDKACSVFMRAAKIFDFKSEKNVLENSHKSLILMLIIATFSVSNNISNISEMVDTVQTVIDIYRELKVNGNLQKVLDFHYSLTSMRVV